jgi:hypothetical protein
MTLAPGDVLQYGALGLLGATLFGVWKLGWRLIDNFDRVAEALDAVRDKIATHDVADTARHDAVKEHATAQADRVIAAVNPTVH